MKQAEDDLHMGDFLLDGFDIRIVHIDDDGFQGLSLLSSHHFFLRLLPFGNLLLKLSIAPVSSSVRS
jgi:hypothetical protein